MPLLFSSPSLTTLIPRCLREECVTYLGTMRKKKWFSGKYRSYILKEITKLAMLPPLYIMAYRYYFRHSLHTICHQEVNSPGGEVQRKGAWLNELHRNRPRATGINLPSGCIKQKILLFKFVWKRCFIYNIIISNWYIQASYSNSHFLTPF